jgi:hypothetical protein
MASNATIALASVGRMSAELNAFRVIEGHIFLADLAGCGINAHTGRTGGRVIIKATDSALPA